MTRDGTSDSWDPWECKPEGNLTLVPPFAPPLQGKLVMACLREVGLLKDIVDPF